MSTTGKSVEIDLKAKFYEDMEKLGYTIKSTEGVETTFMIWSLGYLRGAKDNHEQFEEALNAML